jgi:hypothetical protein
LKKTQNKQEKQNIYKQETANITQASINKRETNLREKNRNVDEVRK